MYNKLLQPRVRTKLRYVDTKEIGHHQTSAAHTYRINSIYDTQYDLGGHQPAFHDQWKTLYSNYRVLAVEWKCTFTPKRTGQYLTIPSGAPFCDETHHNQNHNAGIVFAELGEKVNRVFTSAAQKNFVRETGRTQRNLYYRQTGVAPYRSYNLKGKTTMKRLYKNPDAWEVSTAFGSNPIDVLYIHFGTLSKDGTDLTGYKIDIQMDFIVEFTDPKVVGES